MSKRPVFWIVFLLLSALAVYFAVANFPRAFPIVSLDLRMDRAAALRAAGTLAAQNRWGPDGVSRQAASFGVDDTVQTFVELAGGGKEAFRRMLDRGLYAAYGWRVRCFREGETNETLVRFTPAGTPYGFVEKLREAAPGASLSEAEARHIAEDRARVWRVDLPAYAPVEASKEVKPGGRTDHTFVYERRAERLGEGRYRLRLVVSGDRLTELTHFVKVPEAFTRRYEEMRSANNAIALGALVLAVVLYLVVGGGFGVFTLLRQRWVLWRQPLALGVVVALAQALAVLNSWPLAWMGYDTALPGNTFLIQRVLMVAVTFLAGVLYLTLSFMAAESLTRKAFPHHPQLWRLWSRDAAGTLQVLGRTAGGYLYTGIELAYVVGFYLIASRLLGWWTPSEALVQPDILATYLPWLSAVAPSLHAGIWEECLFRAVPIAGAALIGERLGHRRLWIGAALVLQAVVFGGGHANYASEPAYARLVELILPAMVWGVVYLCFGLLPAIVTHYVFDLALFAIPLFTASSGGARVDQAMVVLCGLAPLGVVLLARLRAPRWGTLAESLLNRAWAPAPAAEPATAPAAAPAPVAAPLSATRVRVALAFGIAGLAVWALAGLRPDAPRLQVGRPEARERALAALAARDVTPAARWKVLTTVAAGIDVPNYFVWRTAGRDTYRSLLGTYLPPPRWNVRRATFAGDVVERAEEWQVEVTGDGAIFRVHHQLPQRRPGPALDETPARELARQALRERFQLDPLGLREISAVSTALPARRDWTFTFADSASHLLKQGQLRLAVEIAGGQVVDARRFVFVPEDWERAFRSEESVLSILGWLRYLVVGLVMIAGMVTAIVLWSRRDFPARFAGVAFAALAVAGLVQFANNWPGVEAQFSTAQPFDLQRAVAIVAGLLQVLSAAAVALFAGFAHGRARAATGARTRAPVVVGIALGFAVAGLVRALWLMSRALAPAWPGYGAAQAVFPVVREGLAPIPTVLTRAAVLLVAFAVAHQLTRGWTRRRVAFGALLFVFGAFGGQLGSGSTPILWLEQAVFSGLVFLAAYVFILRYDFTLVPVAIGTMAALSGLRTALLGAYPGAVAGGLVGLVVAVAVAALWFQALRAPELEEVPQAAASPQVE